MMRFLSIIDEEFIWRAEWLSSGMPLLSTFGRQGNFTRSELGCMDVSAHQLSFL
jgi:hypothetical protein